MIRLMAAITCLTSIIALPTAAQVYTTSAPTRSFRDCSNCSKMIIVPAGRFMMGSPVTEPGHKSDEDPVTQVSVLSFAIGETDVTVAQWRGFVTATGRLDELGCAYSGLLGKEAARASWRHLGFTQGDDEPVVCISWNEAQAYVRWLSDKTGRVYRLPTEAEWEYAARAGTSTAYPWGDTVSHNRANYGAETCCTSATDGADRWLYTSPVGAFPANSFGLYDMIGNAWQWTQDCYVETLAGRPAYSDEAGHLFRHEAGHRTDLKPAI